MQHNLEVGRSVHETGVTVDCHSEKHNRWDSQRTVLLNISVMKMIIIKLIICNGLIWLKDLYFHQVSSCIQ